MELGFDIGSACSDAALIEIVEASPFLIFLLILNHFEILPSGQKWKIHFLAITFYFSKYIFYFEYSKDDNNYTLVVKFREFGHQ